jgi:hypothetical protein
MTLHTITADNIDQESYFNAVRLSCITGYADPIAAIKALSREGKPVQWTVRKDDCGNICL